jgi:hypothetical protein
MLSSPKILLEGLWGQPSFLFNGYCSSFTGVKRHGREADFSPPSGAEVNNKLSCSFRLAV